MRLLVDTHLVLWRLTQNPALPARAAAIMDEADVFVSVVSIWEIAIKWALRRGRADDMPMSGSAFLFEIGQAGLPVSSVTAQHAAAVDALPLHHRDPFDRLLIAQAKSEPMILLTHDRALAAYGDFVVTV